MQVIRKFWVYYDTSVFYDWPFDVCVYSAMNVVIFPHSVFSNYAVLWALWSRENVDLMLT